jgi:ABC-type transporter Mla subunit MlaD
MSTEAPTTPARKSVPLYKRRRLYGAAVLVLAVIVGVVVWATTGGSGSGPLPSFTISVSQGSPAGRIRLP